MDLLRRGRPLIHHRRRGDGVKLLSAATEHFLFSDNVHPPPPPPEDQQSASDCQAFVGPPGEGGKESRSAAEEAGDERQRRSDT